MQFLQRRAAGQIEHTRIAVGPRDSRIARSGGVSRDRQRRQARVGYVQSGMFADFKPTIEDRIGDAFQGSRNRIQFRSSRNLNGTFGILTERPDLGAILERQRLAFGDYDAGGDIPCP